MADEKVIKQYIGFQQGINLGDNYSVPTGAKVQAGGSAKGFERMMQVREMKKQAAAEGLTLAQYMAKLDAEMREAEQAMREFETETKPNVQDAEVIEVTSVGEQVQSDGVKSEDEQKRARLEQSNTAFKSMLGEKKVDLLEIYKFIKEQFTPYLQHQYEWAAVLIYFKDLLVSTDYVAFSAQMMHDEWFGEFKDDRKKKCHNEALGTYTALILERNTDRWSKDLSGISREASDRGISSIKSRLLHLKVYGEGKTFLTK